MQWFKQSFYFIIVAVLVLIIIFQRGCQPSPTTVEKVITKIETKYDTAFVTKKTYVPKYFYKTVVNIDTFSVPIDTTEVLKDYYATYYYKDSLVNDSIKFYINDAISKNRVLTRDLSYSVRTTTNTVTHVKSEKNRELYAGFGLVGGKSSIDYIGPEFLYKNKKDQIYGVGLGVNSDLTPLIGFKMYWKISFKKK